MLKKINLVQPKFYFKVRLGQGRFYTSNLEEILLTINNTKADKYQLVVLFDFFLFHVNECSIVTNTVQNTKNYYYEVTVVTRINESIFILNINQWRNKFVCAFVTLAG